MTLQSRISLPLVAAAMALLALAACGKNDDRTAGQKLDATVSATEREAAQLKADAARTVTEVKQTGSGAVQEAKDAASKLGDKVSMELSDASIVTSINVELARDGKLQPIKIDVEATRGRVALRGTAPDAESVARATTIAAAVKGVTGVDNYLTISKS